MDLQRIMILGGGCMALAACCPCCTQQPPPHMAEPLSGAPPPVSQGVAELRDVTNSAAVIDSAKAIEIARMIVTTNEAWAMDGVVFSVRTNDSGWRVLAVSGQPVQGQHRVVQLDATGKLMKYESGL